MAKKCPNVPIWTAVSVSRNFPSALCTSDASVPTRDIPTAKILPLHARIGSMDCENQQSCIQYELPCVHSTQSQHQCFTESISLRDVKAPSSPISFRCKRCVSIYCKRSLHIGLHGIAVQIRVVWEAMALIFMGFVIMAECRLRCDCTVVVV